MNGDDPNQPAVTPELVVEPAEGEQGEVQRVAILVAHVMGRTPEDVGELGARLLRAGPNDHIATVLAVIAAIRVLHGHDIEAAIAAAERAMEVGPFLDPTLWREKSAALEDDIDLLTLALPLWKFGHAMKDNDKRKKRDPNG